MFNLSTKIFGFNNVKQPQQITVQTNKNTNDDDLDTLDFTIDEMDQAMLELNNDKTNSNCNRNEGSVVNQNNNDDSMVESIILEKTHLVEFCTENNGQYFSKSWIDTFKNYKMIQIVTELTSNTSTTSTGNTYSQYISIFLSMLNIGTKYNFEFVELSDAALFNTGANGNNNSDDTCYDDLNSELFDNIKCRLTKIIEDVQVCKSLSNLNFISSEFELIKNDLKSLFEEQQTKTEVQLHVNLENKFNQLISNYISNIDTNSSKKSVIFYYKHNNFQTWILPTDILNVYHMSIMPKQKSTFKRRLVCPINTTYASSKIFSHKNDLFKSTNNYFKYLKSYFSLEYKYDYNRRGNKKANYEKNMYCKQYF